MRGGGGGGNLNDRKKSGGRAAVADEGGWTNVSKVSQRGYDRIDTTKISNLAQSTNRRVRRLILWIRVARFFWAEYTKPVKVYQNGRKT
jgi:hypothetical protein